MSRLERPLLAKTIAADGRYRPPRRAHTPNQDEPQSWEPVNFLVDPGTEMTTLPAARAKQLGIPFPQKPVPAAWHHRQERGGPGGPHPGSCGWDGPDRVRLSVLLHRRP